MKKTIFAIALSLSMLLGTEQSTAQIDFGIVAGMNLSKAYFHEPVDRNFSSDNKCGWFVGPKLEFTVPIIGIGIDASAQYSQRSINGADDITGQENTRTLKSLEFPINIRYQFGAPSILAGYLATGPQFGFNVGSKSFRSFWNHEEYRIKNSILSWNIGVGLKVLKHVEIGVGYNIALSKFAKTNTSRESVKSNSFQAHLGYFF